MNYLRGLSAFVVAYSASAIVWFGGFLRPIGFLTLWNDRLAVDNWTVVVLAGIGFGLGLALLGLRFSLKLRYAPAVFIACAMTCSTIALGIYTENTRSREIEKFSPDLEMRASFFRSLRASPRDFQFFLHGAALKDCVPYAWSYRTMSFYELSQNVAVNVLPAAWLEDCDIVRTQ